MKKTILGLALSLLIGASSFANNEVTLNQKAEQSFKKEFAQAKDVSWQKSGDLVKATFTLNDSHQKDRIEAILSALVNNSA